MPLHQVRVSELAVVAQASAPDVDRGPWPFGGDLPQGVWSLLPLATGGRDHPGVSWRVGTWSWWYMAVSAFWVEPPSSSPAELLRVTAMWPRARYLTSFQVPLRFISENWPKGLLIKYSRMNLCLFLSVLVEIPLKWERGNLKNHILV